jgi:fructose-1,6-bisphosphatase
MDAVGLRALQHRLPNVTTALAEIQLIYYPREAFHLRSLAVYALVVAGDLGDRGPRIDRVIDALKRQRDVFITWGNHDVEWMGASLGQEALVATVLRISQRYGRLAQLEEGIPVEPIEHETKSR